MFFKSKDPLREMDLEFFRRFDPFSHFVASELVHTGNFDNYSAEFENGEPHPINEALKCSFQRVESQKKVFTRVFRYFASETLMLLILSSPPHAPFYRVASTLRGLKLNKAFDLISRRKIPSGFEREVKGEDVDDFGNWLGFKMFGKRDFFTEHSTENVLELIIEEAYLLCERGAINAFKHGRPISAGQSLSGQISKDGKHIAKITPVVGIQWVEWVTGPDNNFSIRTETEEVDLEYDKKRLFDVCLIMNSIKDFRLAQLEGNNPIQITLPKVEKLKGVVRHNHHQKNFSDEQ
jgi:hypothetical protein